MALAVQFTRRLARTTGLDTSDRLVKAAALLSAALIAAAAILKPGILLVLADFVMLIALGLGAVIAITVAAIVLAYLAGAMLTVFILATDRRPRR